MLFFTGERIMGNILNRIHTGKLQSVTEDKLKKRHDQDLQPAWYLSATHQAHLHHVIQSPGCYGERVHAFLGPYWSFGRVSCGSKLDRACCHSHTTSWIFLIYCIYCNIFFHVHIMIYEGWPRLVWAWKQKREWWLKVFRKHCKRWRVPLCKRQ